MTFNNAEIEGGDFRNLGPGTYNVRVWDHKFRDDSVSVMFKATNGATHWEIFSLSDAAMWRLKALSLACGIGPKDQWEMDDIRSRDLCIKIVTEEYQGKERNRIKWFGPATEQNEFIDPMDDQGGDSPF